MRRWPQGSAAAENQTGHESAVGLWPVCVLLRSSSPLQRQKPSLHPRENAVFEPITRRAVILYCTRNVINLN